MLCFSFIVYVCISVISFVVCEFGKHIYSESFGVFNLLYRRLYVVKLKDMLLRLSFYVRIREVHIVSVLVFVPSVYGFIKAFPTFCMPIDIRQKIGTFLYVTVKSLYEGISCRWGAAFFYYSQVRERYYFPSSLVYPVLSEFKSK